MQRVFLAGGKDASPPRPKLGANERLTVLMCEICSLSVSVSAFSHRWVALCSPRTLHPIQQPSRALLWLKNVDFRCLRHPRPVRCPPARFPSLSAVRTSLSGVASFSTSRFTCRGGGARLGKPVLDRQFVRDQLYFWY